MKRTFSWLLGAPPQPMERTGCLYIIYNNFSSLGLKSIVQVHVSFDQCVLGGPAFVAPLHVGAMLTKKLQATVPAGLRVLTPQQNSVTRGNIKLSLLVLPHWIYGQLNSQSESGWQSLYTRSPQWEHVHQPREDPSSGRRPL